MASEALEFIKKAEKDSAELIKEAEIAAEQSILDAKKQKERELSDFKEKLEADKKQAMDAARQLAEERAKTVLELAHGKLDKLSGKAADVAQKAKAAVTEELLR